MATTIVTKSGSGAPTASDLVAGELAVDLTNGRLYTENSGGTVLELGLNPNGNVNVTGSVTTTGLTVSGTAGTLATLDRTGSNGVYLGLTDNSGSNVFLGNSGGQFQVQTAGASYSSKLTVESNGDISFYEDTGTTPKFFWDASTESLNLGTTSLTTLGTFVVQQSADSKGIALVDSAAANTFFIENQGDEVKFRLNATSPFTFTHNTTERMRISATGDVGIGTSTPTLVGFGTGANGLEIADATLAGIRLNGNAADSMYLVSGAGKHWVYGRGAVPMTFSTNGGERMRIDASGNLLVGTTDTTPYNNTSGGGFVVASNGLTSIARETTASNQAVLHLNNTGVDGTIAEFAKDGTTVGNIGVKTGSMYIGTGDAGIGFNHHGGGNLDSIMPYSITAGAFQNGAVDIGGSVNRFKDLYLSGYIQVGADENISWGGTYGAGKPTITAGANFIALYPAGITSGESVRLDASGNLLVGCTSSAYLTADSGVQLYAYGGARFGADGTTARNLISFVNGTDGTPAEVGAIQTNGSSTSYLTSSDQRLKENIEDADDAGSKIDTIQVRKFDWKADGSHQDYGMVAQELIEVAPEAVSAPEDPEDMMGVDYSKLVPMMLKEIQSLRARIAALES